MGRGKSAVIEVSEEKELLENVSLYELSKSEPVGTKLDIVTHGLGEIENEYGSAYVLSDGQKITFVNFGFDDKESTVHRAIRDAIENDPTIVEHNMVISLRLHKPKNKSYNNYWAVDRIQVYKERANIPYNERADAPPQKTIVEYV